MANLARTASTHLAAAAILAGAFAATTAAQGHSLTGFVDQADRSGVEAATVKGAGPSSEVRSWSRGETTGFALFDYSPPTVGISWSQLPFAEPIPASSGPDRNSAISSELITFKDLSAGWDGPGSVAPTVAAVDEALTFLDMIAQYPEEPEVMVAADGEVGFYWKNDTGFVDISFRGAGEASYFARTGAESVKGRLALLGLKSLPAELARIVESVGSA